MTAAPRKKRGRPKDEASLARRREEILRAAAQVFAAHGYPGADVQLVADALGLAKGTLYRYFASKEELFLAAVDRGMRRLREAVDAEWDEADDPLDRIARAIRTYLTFFKAHPEYAELIIQERAEYRDRRSSSYFRHHKGARDEGPWPALLRGLIAAGRLRDVPVERVMDVLGDLVYGTMFTNHFSGRHKAVEVQARDILDVVFLGILSDSERKRSRRGGGFSPFRESP